MNYMFGYGSIMNKTSLMKTLNDPSDAVSATLRGYQRKCNATHGGEPYLYMNIVEQPDFSVEGVLVPLTDEELVRMKERELGYEAVDVTNRITPNVEGLVVAFIAPDLALPDKTVPRSYLATCTRDMSEEEKSKWIADTIIENPIVDDLEDPVYANAAF